MKYFAGSKKSTTFAEKIHFCEAFHNKAISRRYLSPAFRGTFLLSIFSFFTNVQRYFCCSNDYNAHYYFFILNGMMVKKAALVGTHRPTEAHRLQGLLLPEKCKIHADRSFVGMHIS